MRPLSSRIALFLFIDVTLLVLGLVNISSVTQRAKVPFDSETRSGSVVIQTIHDGVSSGTLRKGDAVLAWNTTRVVNHEALEILGDLHRVGDRVKIEFERENERGTTEITLVPFYPSPRFMLVFAFVGVVVWCMGIVILLSRQKGIAVSTLHWLMISLASTLLMTQGPIEAGAVAVVKRSLLFLSYGLLGAIFVFLTLIFPRRKFAGPAFVALVVFSPAAILIVLLISSFFRARASLSPDDFLSFQSVNNVFHIALALYALSGIVSLAHSFWTSESKEEHRRLQWILWGFMVGATPFVIFVALPLAFGMGEIIAEEYATVFLLAAPLALSISVLRYRLFDIEIVINRSIVYALLTFLIGSVYVLAVVLLVSVFGEEARFSEYALIVLVTLGVAFAFQPVRTRLQNFVDETLFPARVNFRRVLTAISQQLQHALSSDQLVALLTESIHNVIPFNAVAVYVSVPGYLRMKDARGEPLNETLSLKEEHRSVFLSASVFATSESINFHREDVDTTKESLLRRFGCSLCIPFISESKQLLGVLAARPSSTTGKFNEEEIDLLLTVCTQAAEVLGNLVLQEKIILEQEERKRIEELNKLKSYFVSSVSHELRTPLTSIKMFAETMRLLKHKEVRKRREYLEIIEGETERLSRLIGNVLDFAKIERGVKEYEFSDTNIVDAVQRAVRAMKYQFSIEGASFSAKLPGKSLQLLADADAIEEVVLNLLSNALKYSIGKKKVSLKLHRRNGKVALEVSDNGIGISQEERTKIFEPFYRARGSSSPHAGGTGLGLALVKHIVDAHQGTISVKSKVGKGSVFTVELPIRSSQ